MHTYIYAYIHTYIHTHTHTHIHATVHTYIHTHIHTYIHTYIHTHTHTYRLKAYVPGTKSVPTALKIDTKSLEKYLKGAGIPALAGEITGIRQFGHGQSNPTYHVTIDGSKVVQVFEQPRIIFLDNTRIYISYTHTFIEPHIVFFDNTRINIGYTHSFIEFALCNRIYSCIALYVV